MGTSTPAQRELDPLEQAEVFAPLLLAYASDLQRFVNRRVETIEVVDQQTSRRRVSVDVTVRRGGNLEAAGQQRLRVLPIGLLARQPLHNFDITDEDGRALPILTRDEGERIVVAGLRSYAEEILKELEVELVDPVAEDLDTLATGTEVQALSAYLRMLEASAAEPGDETDQELRAALEQRKALFDNPAMRRLMRLLTRAFILFVQTDVEVGSRRIYKFTFEHATNTKERSARRWLMVRLGLRHSHMPLDATAAQQARSFHVEVAAPPNLEIARARLHAAGCRDEKAGGGLGRVHLNIAQATGPGTVDIKFRTQRGGFLRAALLTSALACALLFLGRTRLDNLATEVEAASTMLLIVPGLLAAYLARPGEHALASALLVGVRAMVLVTGLCSIGAGLVLVVELSAEDRELWWAFLAYLSGLAAFFVALANVLPSKGRA